MNPSAIKGVEVVSDGEAGITLRHPTRGEVALRGVAAAVWRQADGSRSVEELAAAVNADASAVWAALDELGDAELLGERVAPPAGIHENVQREVIFADDAAAAADPGAAARLEAQFDAEAAKGEAELKIPQAEERRKQQQEAKQDAEEQAASAAALAALDNRGETADGVMIPDATPAEESELVSEEKKKRDRLDGEVADGVMVPDAGPPVADGVMLPDAAPAEPPDGIMLPDAAPAEPSDGVMVPEAAPPVADGVMVPDTAPAEPPDGVMLPDAAPAEPADGVMIPDAAPPVTDGIILTDETSEERVGEEKEKSERGPEDGAVNVHMDEEEKKSAS